MTALVVVAPTDAKLVHAWLDSDSPWMPQALADAHRELDTALEAAIAEYARLGLSADEISETIAEATFAAWAHLPDELEAPESAQDAEGRS